MRWMSMKVLSRYVVMLLPLLIMVGAALSGQAQTQSTTPAKAPAKPKAQPRQKAPAKPPEWLNVQVVRVKPEMLTEWQDLQRNETIPGLKKGGLTWRAAWQTAVFGESYEYVLVSQIEKFAQFDGTSPLEKALGAEGLRAYGAKLRRLINSSHTYAIMGRPDLSYEKEMTGPPKMALITSSHVVPGRNLQFESLIKNEVVPAMKKAGVGGFWMNQTVFGGDVHEYVSLVIFDNFADLDKGLPLVRALGQAGANALLQKISGLVAHQERSVSRYVADLSIEPPQPSK